MQPAFPGGLPGLMTARYPAFPKGMRIIDAMLCRAMPPAWSAVRPTGNACGSAARAR